MMQGRAYFAGHPAFVTAYVEDARVGEKFGG